MPVRAASETLSSGEDRPAYGGTYFGTRHPPLGQINRENVDDLGRVWAYRTGDLPPEDGEAAWSPESTPPKIDGDLVLCTLTNIVLRVDAAIGREEWRYDPQLPMTPPPRRRLPRGGPSRRSRGRAERILVATLDVRLIAVDAQLGEPCQELDLNGVSSPEVGLGGTVSGRVAVTSPRRSFAASSS